MSMSCQFKTFTFSYTPCGIKYLYVPFIHSCGLCKSVNILEKRNNCWFFSTVITIVAVVFVIIIFSCCCCCCVYIVLRLILQLNSFDLISVLHWNLSQVISLLFPLPPPSSFSSYMHSFIQFESFEQTAPPLLLPPGAAQQIIVCCWASVFVLHSKENIFVLLCVFKCFFTFHIALHVVSVLELNALTRFPFRFVFLFLS